MKGFVGNDVPKLDAASGRRLMRALSGAIGKGLVSSCHDCSDGGLSVALAEMSLAGGLGMDIRFDPSQLPIGQRALADHILLFSESNTRFIVEVADEKKFSAALRGFPIWRLGTVTKDRIFKIRNINKKAIVHTTIDKLKASWQGTFKDL